MSTTWSTDDADLVAGYRAECEDERKFAERVIEAAKELGKNSGPLRSGGMFGGWKTVGLKVLDPNDPPQGWIYRKRDDMLVPRRGKPGDQARAWLELWQPTANGRVYLEQRGLAPYSVAFPRFGKPTIVLHDNAIWAHYSGDPARDPLAMRAEEFITEPPAPWVERTLSRWLTVKAEIAAEQESKLAAEAAGEGTDGNA